MLKNEIELKKYYSKKFCKGKKIIKRIIKGKNLIGKK
jgi:hypothetical protein